MKRYVYGAGSFAIALAAGVMPVMAMAQTEGEVKVEAAAVTTTVVEPAANTAPTPKPTLYGERRAEIKDMRAEVREKRVENRAEVKTMVGEKRTMIEEKKGMVGEKREEMKGQIQEKRVEIKEKREEMKGEIAEKRVEIKEKREEMREEMKKRIETRIEFKEGTTTRAVSLEELRKKREERRAEFVGEERSTTPKFRNVVKNANEVRSAVHSLLEAEGLTGGVGPRISEIAKRMNDAVGSTTNAEAQIESRGLLRKALFGGDRTAAEAIQQGVEKNKENIAELTTLLADPSVSAEVAEDLKGQLVVLEKAQERLTTLAEKESKRASLLGWLFR
jgi:chromosome segregation ATPase